MRVELRVEARHDLLEGAWFYEQQREGLGDYFTDRLFEDLERLETEAGIHSKVFGLHRKLSKRFPFAIYYRVQESVSTLSQFSTVGVTQTRSTHDSKEQAVKPPERQPGSGVIAITQCSTRIERRRQ